MTELLDITRKDYTLFFPNSGRFSLLDDKADQQFEERMLQDEDNKMVTTLFDLEFGVITFNCFDAYLNECLSTRRILNKRHGTVYYLRENATTALRGLEKVRIYNNEHY